mmetsp:Transcript_15579/g.38780  ORF Transcript_15579/g.38780 Transcript_15579/m.38780 type:complete len:330 (+) Transcript_15579:2871-3860(+)
MGAPDASDEGVTREVMLSVRWLPPLRPGPAPQMGSAEAAGAGKALGGTLCLSPACCASGGGAAAATSPLYSSNRASSSGWTALMCCSTASSSCCSCASGCASLLSASLRLISPTSSACLAATAALTLATSEAGTTLLPVSAPAPARIPPGLMLRARPDDPAAVARSLLALRALGPATAAESPGERLGALLERVAAEGAAPGCMRVISDTPGLPCAACSALARTLAATRGADWARAAAGFTANAEVAAGGACCWAACWCCSLELASVPYDCLTAPLGALGPALRGARVVAVAAATLTSSGMPSGDVTAPRLPGLPGPGLPAPWRAAASSA